MQNGEKEGSIQGKFRKEESCFEELQKNTGDSRYALDMVLTGHSFHILT